MSPPQPPGGGEFFWFQIDRFRSGWEGLLTFQPPYPVLVLVQDDCGFSERPCLRNSLVNTGIRYFSFFSPCGRIRGLAAPLARSLEALLTLGRASRDRVDRSPRSSGESTGESRPTSRKVRSYAPIDVASLRVSMSESDRPVAGGHVHPPHRICVRTICEVRRCDVQTRARESGEQRPRANSP